MKVKGTISQLGISGVISQLNVRGSISQLGVSGVISEGGFVGTAPVLQTATVEDDEKTKVVLTFDRNLDTSSVPATTDFTLSDRTITDIVILGITVTLTVSVAYAAPDTITVTYTQGSTPLQATDGADVADISESVTNNIVAATPVIQSAYITNDAPADIYLEYDYTLDDTSIPDAEDFELSLGTISTVNITAQYVIITVTENYEYGDEVTISYTKGDNPIKNYTTGDEADSFSDQEVTNNVEEGYDADLLTYISGLATPLSTGQKDLLNTFILALKSGLSITNLSDFFDVMYVLANETEEAALRNLVKRAHDCTKVSTPAFVALEGYTGATGKYLDTNFNGAASGVNYTLNNASLGVYSRTDADGPYSDIGNRTSTSDYTAILARYSGNTVMRLHNATNPAVQDAEADSLGMFIVTRNGNTAGALAGQHNKTDLVIINTGNTTNIPNCNIFIGARNNNGTPEQVSPRQLSFAFAGKYLDPTQRDLVVDAFEAYMDANGKGVI